MDQVTAIVMAIIGSILTAATPLIITWLRQQAIIKQFHLENLCEARIPQIVEWVEAWGKTCIAETGKKPSSTAKLQKALSFAESLIPWIKDPDELRGRIEAALTEKQGVVRIGKQKEE